MDCADQSVLKGGILAPLGCRVIFEEIQQDEKDVLPGIETEKKAVKVTEKLVDISE